jgi:hypothetical protein
MGTVNSRNSRGSSNKIRINDRRRIKYRKFTKADLIKASKKYVSSDEYLN